MDNLREALLELLEGHAHMGLEEAVEDFPMAAINQNPPNVSYTPYQLLEHIRLTQLDLLNYIFDTNYATPDWPKDYWPPKDKKATAKEWRKAVLDIRKDLNKFKKLVRDKKIDLFSTVKGGGDHNILREVLLACDHNAYHIGEFATWRDIMKTWPKGRKP